MREVATYLATEIGKEQGKLQEVVTVPDGYLRAHFEKWGFEYAPGHPDDVTIGLAGPGEGDVAVITIRGFGQELNFALFRGAERDNYLYDKHLVVTECRKALESLVKNR
jgi:hypothetical protein